MFLYLEPHILNSLIKLLRKDLAECARLGPARYGASNTKICDSITEMQVVVHLQ